MRHQPILITICICASIIIASSIIARGGDINPPLGPIAPSGPSLADIYTQTSLMTEAMLGPPNRSDGWDSLVFASAGGRTDPTVVLTGSGVLHSIVWSGAPTNRLQLFSASGELLFELWSLGSIPQGFTQGTLPGPFVLDLRFRDGLVIIADSGQGDPIRINILYRLDSTDEPAQ